MREVIPLLIMGVANSAILWYVIRWAGARRQKDLFEGFARRFPRKCQECSYAAWTRMHGVKAAENEHHECPEMDYQTYREPVTERIEVSCAPMTPRELAWKARYERSGVEVIRSQIPEPSHGRAHRG